MSVRSERSKALHSHRIGYSKEEIPRKKDDRMASFAQDTASEVEICLLTIKECFVYKVPPLRTASGHRAEDWGLANPLFTGCLKLFQKGDSLRLVVYAFKDPKNSNVTDDNIKEFGECPIAVKPGENILHFVDSVIDSSRYYVIRIKDPRSTRTTLLGIGFRERDDAFDLKNSLNEYVKFINRMDLASQLAATSLVDSLSSDGIGRSAGEGEVVDGADGEYLLTSTNDAAAGGAGAAGYSHIPALKEGEKIKISIGAKHKHTHSKETTSSGHTTGGSGGGGSGVKFGGLRPPPPAGSVVHFLGGNPEPQEPAPATSTAPVPATTSAADVSGGSSGASGEGGAVEDEWGDFK